MRYLNSGIFQHEVLEYVKGNNDVQKDVLKELSEKQKVIIEMIIRLLLILSYRQRQFRKRCRKRKVSMREPSKGILPN